MRAADDESLAAAEEVHVAELQDLQRRRGEMTELTVDAVTKTREWLEAKMREGDKKKTKKKYEEEAKAGHTPNH